MQKPEIGDCYRIFNQYGLQDGYIIKILHVKENIATYINLNGDQTPRPWDYAKFPEHLSWKLSPLEVELL